ncbi:hypothetical protein V8B55DRAFT_1516815 [Mucor lusitanicus]|uniref:Uncharacterized protein n=2 Tax=Mucor circinelloides f. lusitanicus TaxID=29924 RepID=A0A168L2W9_MUCCL|nr:hypothetical protein FB192DRAFT_1399482 [Mucor lusitanicus]OAD03051.1 hypothetical protein MUCCIDRAFT_156042 [Mucor lusitanicus CBS 277.49]
MTTFFENPHYYSSQVKLEDPSMLPLSPLEQQQQQQPDDFQDFFVAYKSSSSDLCRDVDYWKYAVSQMQQHIFNTSSATYSSPEAYFLKKAKNTSVANDLHALISNNGTFRFNCDPMCAPDPLTYRRHRSENLLLRMIHCRNLDMNQISLMRLSKGVFVHQKWQSSVPQPSPTLSCIEEVMANEFIDMQDEAPIDTFQFGDACHRMNNLTSSCYDMFIPYSYTFGARYTNPYNNASDLVIRGKLPLWCQTLFLSNCIKQTEPVQAHVPRSGLFPFAPQVTVTFKPLIQDETDSIVPELTVLYERFTMEDMDDAFIFPELTDEELELTWPERKKQVYQRILVCDIPDDLAKILSDMATIWAASKGLML